MNKLLEDALLVAVHANPLNSKETVDLFSVVSHEVEAARLVGGDVILHRLGVGTFPCCRRSFGAFPGAVEHHWERLALRPEGVRVGAAKQRHY